MNDYLQQLERLGELHAKGVLTKEEFESEKARLLTQQLTQPQHSAEDRRNWFHRNRLIVAGIAGLLVIGSALGLAARYDAGNGGTAEEETAKHVDSRPSEPQAVGDGELGFVDASKCLPNAALAGLIGRIEEAGRASPGDGRLVFVEGGPPVAVDSAVVRNGDREITLARLPLARQLFGLSTAEMRSISWDGGRGFRITFRDSESALRRALTSNGFRLAAESDDAPASAAVIAVEPAGTGSSLVCFQSEEVATASEQGEDNAA